MLILFLYPYHSVGVAFTLIKILWINSFLDTVKQSIRGFGNNVLYKFTFYVTLLGPFV